MTAIAQSISFTTALVVFLNCTAVYCTENVLGEQKTCHCLLSANFHNFWHMYTTVNFLLEDI